MVPLLETLVCNGYIEKIDGRKIYVKAEITSIDGQTVYDTCTMLWLVMERKPLSHL